MVLNASTSNLKPAAALPGAHGPIVSMSCMRSASKTFSPSGCAGAAGAGVDWGRGPQARFARETGRQTRRSCEGCCDAGVARAKCRTLIIAASRLGQQSLIGTKHALKDETLVATAARLLELAIFAGAHLDARDGLTLVHAREHAVGNLGQQCTVEDVVLPRGHRPSGLIRHRAGSKTPRHASSFCGWRPSTAACHSLKCCQKQSSKMTVAASVRPRTWLQQLTASAQAVMLALLNEP